MAVEEPTIDRPAQELESLFRASHERTREPVLESPGDALVSTVAIEAEYDIDAVIEDDPAYLAGPNTDGRLFVVRPDGRLDGCVLHQRSAARAEVKRL